MNTLEARIKGIKCDNAECDYRDDSVTVEDYPEWLDRPCPKCGSNLLTKADLDLVKAIMATADLINLIIPAEENDDTATTTFRVHMDGSGSMELEEKK